MRRYFFIADRLEDLEKVEDTMKMQGFADNQYHVLSEDDLSAEKRHLHDVTSIFKRDVIHFAEIGALVGAGAAVLILALAGLSGWTAGAFGWTPYIALAVLAFCFCTWEGAFLGIQIPNVQFKRFSDVLKQGKHVFFVDVDDKQRDVLDPIVKWHPELKLAGNGAGMPAWFLRSSQSIKDLIKTLP